jgi:hypothetical protein
VTPSFYFDSIVTQIHYQVKSWGTKLPFDGATLPEQVPTAALKAVFRLESAEPGAEADLEPDLELLLQFCQQVIHRAMLRPRLNGTGRMVSGFFFLGIRLFYSVFQVCESTPGISPIGLPP